MVDTLPVIWLTVNTNFDQWHLQFIYRPQDCQVNKKSRRIPCFVELFSTKRWKLHWFLHSSENAGEELELVSQEFVDQVIDSSVCVFRTQHSVPLLKTTFRVCSCGPGWPLKIIASVISAAASTKYWKLHPSGSDPDPWIYPGSPGTPILYEDLSSQSVSQHVQRCAPIWTQMSTFFVCNNRIA